MDKKLHVNCITINTDASFDCKHKVGGYAFYIISDVFKIKKSGMFKKQPSTAMEAEMMCMANALHTLLLQKELPSANLIIINSDCLYSFQHIKRKSKNETGKKCPSNQIEFCEWHIDYVAWLEKKLSELLPLTECSEQKLQWIARQYKFSNSLNHVDKNYQHQIESHKFLDSVLRMYLKREVEQSDRTVCTYNNIKGNKNNYHLLYNNILIGTVTKTYSRKFNTYMLKFNPKKK